MRQHLQTYAITAVTHHRRRIFQRTLIAGLFITTLFRYRDAGRFLLYAFVVMPDHIHIIITPSSNDPIERCVQLIKGGFSFAARKDQSGEIWQDGYYAHRVTDELDFSAQIAYILNNPIRKKYTDYPHIHTTPENAPRIDALPTWPLHIF